jgi:hypothetical protein
MDGQPRKRKLRLPQRVNLLREIERAGVRRTQRPLLQELKQKIARPRALFSHRFTQQEVERPDDLLYNILRQFQNTPFTARITVGNQILKEHNFNFQGQRAGKAYETFRLFFFEDNASDRDFLPDTNMKIKIYPLRRQEPIPVFQRFRDGQEHCIFTPLIKLWETPAKSKSTQKEHDQILKRIKKLAEKYGNSPVPQTEMEDVAKQSNTTIRIYDPLGNPYLTYNKSARKTLHLTLTRNNHVEPSNEEKETEEITHEEAITYLKTKDDWTLIGTLTDPIIIYTPTHRYEIINPMKPYLEEIREQIPYSTKLDAKKYPIINDFILEARIINSATLTFQEEYDAHYDLEKAYTQFHTTPYYKGFLGIIHQWRSLQDNSFLHTHLGIYKCKIIQSTPLARMMGLKEDNEYILPSPEWEFFQDNGVILQVISGLWGSTFDFTFPESSKQTVKTRIGENKPFRIFAGQCSNVTNKYDKDTYTIPSTEEYAQHLATLYPDTFYNEELNIAQVHIPKETVRTNHHILAFITSYTRIVMLTEMLKFNLNDISAITLDGLYFKGLPPNNLIPQFRPKPAKHDPYGESLWYTPSTIQENFPPLTVHNESQFFSGAGGTGKTHTILSNTGFNDPLYVSPTNELARQKREDYNTNATTLHKLTGEKCRSYEELYGTPPVIFIDEITQCEAEMINKAISLYPNSLIFIAGDVDEQGRHFQCKYGNQIWKPTLPVIHFTQDYRSLTPTLTKMKEDLRHFMKQDPSPYDVKLYAHKHFNHISKDEAITNFTTDDIWIAGTHKYIKTIPHKVHTTHSYQGKTINPPSKLYISTNDLFEHTMFYTALSRVRHHEQLVFVD